MAKGSAGYNANVYMTGTSTGMTDEPCTEVSGTVFQITATTKRILDDDVAVVVKANAVIQSGNYTLDENFGKITWTDGSHTGETVIVTASYLPRYAIAKLKNASLSMSYDEEDTTALGDPAEDTTLLILRADMSFESVSPLQDDIYSTTDIEDMFLSRELKVWEFQPLGSSVEVYRLRGHKTQLDKSADPGSTVKATFTVAGSKGNAETLISKGAP